MHTRVAAAVLTTMALVFVSACSSSGLLGKQYEYEEDLTIGLDGSATLIVNASLPALSALRGLSVPTEPSPRVDRDAIRALFESPVTDVRRVSRPWRRKGRTFVGVRIAVADVRRLHEAAPFSWSRYQFSQENGRHIYHQTVGPSAFKPGTLQKVGWTGGELVAFRLHLPSKITSHNARDVATNATAEIRRGNILAWEQQLADRLDGRAVEIHVEMEGESILYRTLWLFAAAFAAAVLVLVGLIWWTVRKGREQDEPAIG